jgi:hypothetical protein
MFAEIDKKLKNSLPFVLITVGNKLYQKPVVHTESFDYHQVIWVTRGEGVFFVRDKKYILSEGMGLFTRACVPHSYSGKSFDTSWCTFSLNDATLDFLGVADHLVFEMPPYLDRDAEQLESFANGDSTPLSRSAMGYSFVTELFSSIMAKEEQLSQKVRRMLEQRYSEPMSLSDIADEFALDKFKLCRIYKKERGVTVMDDLLKIRISKANRKGVSS